jgi:hypothetical protein
MKKMILLAVAVWVISVCVSAPKSGGWAKPNATNDDFYRDRGECTFEARKYNRTNMPFDPILFGACRSSKGWYWEEN